VFFNRQEEHFLSTYTQLTLEDRIKISVLMQQGFAQRGIAEQVGKSPSTISRELSRNSVGAGYFYSTAHILAVNRKIEASSMSRIDEETWEWVKEKLLLQWSPEQISNRIKIEHGISISHEIIYQYIKEDRQQGGILYLNLRHGKRKRKKRFGGRDKRGQIPNRTSIEDRPDIINNRERIGDLEGDLIIGKDHQGKALTLVDRVSLLVKIEKLESKNAEHVSEKTINSIKDIDMPVYSITFDNGLEFAAHEAITKATAAKIYFAHPYSSFERGTNENMNGLIRQYFPKKTNLSKIPLSEYEKVENLLNHRPRKKLGYLSPYEKHYGKQYYYF
jgi:IS30 family transposase